MSSRRKQALGRGLGALLGGSSHSGALTSSSLVTSPAVSDAAEAPRQVQQIQTPVEDHMLAVERISPNPRQPRTTFDPLRLDELAESIRAHGILQPLLVTREGDSWILLAGERRLRAAQIVGLKEVPVRVIEATDEQRLEFAIIENVQRDDLNPVEEALAYQQLVSSFGYTQDRVAKQVGKSRVAISNSLRLLNLQRSCLADLRDGKLSAGHARAILMLSGADQQEDLRSMIAQEDLSVREAEKRAREILAGTWKPGAKPSRKTTSDREQDLDVVSLQDRLTLLLGCKVRLKPRSKTSGSLDIQYRSLDDLDRVFEKLGFHPDGD